MENLDEDLRVNIRSMGIYRSTHGTFYCKFIVAVLWHSNTTDHMSLPNDCRRLV